jgi:hypothetical protein
MTSPEVDPNAEFDPLLRWGARVALGHPPLHLHCAPDGVDHARELGKEAVAGILHDPPPVFGDLRIDQLGEVRFQPLVGSLLIGPIRREYPATSAARIAVRRRTDSIENTPKTASTLAIGASNAALISFGFPESVGDCRRIRCFPVDAP